MMSPTIHTESSGAMSSSWTLHPSFKLTANLDKLHQSYYPWQVLNSERPSESSPVALVDSYFTDESRQASLAALSADERCAVEALQKFSAQGHMTFPSGRAQRPPVQRRSKSDADMKYVATDSNPTPINLFRREPEASSTQALRSLIVNLESQLTEAYYEIRTAREERDEMAREKDEQQQILYDAERRMDDILRRHHHGPHVKPYMDDLRNLHEMIYSYEASLLEAGVDPTTLHYRSSLEVLRSQLHFPIKAPRVRPSHASLPSTENGSAYFATPPQTPEVRPSVTMPNAAPVYHFDHAAFTDAREALILPRRTPPVPM